MKTLYILFWFLIGLKLCVAQAQTIKCDNISWVPNLYEDKTIAYCPTIRNNFYISNDTKFDYLTVYYC